VSPDVRSPALPVVIRDPLLQICFSFLQHAQKAEPRRQGSARFHLTVTCSGDDPRYFAAVLSAAMSASLRSVITPIMLSR